MSGNKTLKALKNKLLKFKDWLIRVVLLLFQLNLLFIILYRVLPVPVTPLQVIRVFEQIGNSETIKLKKSWRSIDHIGNKMCCAAITAEDLKFSEHYGFDFEQINKALKNTFNRGRKLRGASTISQQTAKNLFFTPDRNWLRKVLEFYVTVSIEVLWTKKRILEVYLNIIEMGDGIYGAEAAAQNYFNKPAENLSSAQAALIAACFPNPRRWQPNRLTRYINRKQSLIMRYMNVAQLP